MSDHRSTMDHKALDRCREWLDLPQGERLTAEHFDANPGSLRAQWLELARHYQTLAGVR